MLLVAGFILLIAAILWIADQCICDTSVDFARAARVLVILAGLLVGLNFMLYPGLHG